VSMVHVHVHAFSPCLHMFTLEVHVLPACSS
jgi:hypothetical protein